MASTIKKLFNLALFAGVMLTPNLVFAQPFSIFNESRDCKNGICNLCDLLVIIQNTVNYALLLLIPIAAIFIIYGGYQIMTAGANPSGIKTGWSTILHTVIGIAFVFGAWLIVNTVITYLAAGYFQAPWYKISCNAGVAPIVVNTGGDGKIDPFAAGKIDDGTTLVDGYDISTPEAQSLLNQNESWDQNPTSDVCTLSALQSYRSTIQDAANQYGVDSARLQAIVMAESSGNSNAVHKDLDGMSSYGLMQVRPDTARGLDPSLRGLSNDQIAQKLKDPNYNIQLGTKYYSSLLKKYNGDATRASAAYNGGPGANGASQNCPGLLRWQCQWDNNAHTVPNTGYNPTRTYINNINNDVLKINSNGC